MLFNNSFNHKHSIHKHFIMNKHTVLKTYFSKTGRNVRMKKRDIIIIPIIPYFKTLQLIKLTTNNDILIDHALRALIAYNLYQKK